jgi:hypothetical protein
MLGLKFAFPGSRQRRSTTPLPALRKPTVASANLHRRDYIYRSGYCFHLLDVRLAAARRGSRIPPALLRAKLHGASPACLACRVVAPPMGYIESFLVEEETYQAWRLLKSKGRKVLTTVATSSKYDQLSCRATMKIRGCAY